MAQVAERVSGFGTTIFAHINELVEKYGALNLGQGKPDFDGPPSMLFAAAEAMQLGLANQYPPGFGRMDLRQALAQMLKRRYQLDLDPQHNILITSGASGALFCALMGHINPDDEVILLEPFFDLYETTLKMAGAKIVYVPMYPPTWEFNPDELRAAFTPRTKAIVINTPHNPTGRVYTREELTLIAELCQEHDVIAICDEVYEYMVYDHYQHIPLATLPNMANRTITISSAAKTFSVTGWKVGWAYGHPDLITGLWRVHQNTTFAINHPGQVGVLHGLNLGEGYFRDFLDAYHTKRRLLLEALRQVGFQAQTPQGAFYIMADFSPISQEDDMTFVKRLISQYRVAAIPPSTFFSVPHQHLARNYLRFAYGKLDSDLKKVAERLEHLR